MRSMSMAEKAMIFSYSLLTSQINLVLESVIQDRPLTHAQCSVLQDGADLLKKTIEGATLVEGKPFQEGFAPTIRGLSVYGYALSTLRKLEFARTVDDFTAFFRKLHEELSKLIKEQKKDDVNVLDLKKFFMALGSSFRSDVQKETYPKEKTFPRQRSLDEYLHI
jgi:hypothetical protein